MDCAFATSASGPVLRSRIGGWLAAEYRDKKPSTRTTRQRVESTFHTVPRFCIYPRKEIRTWNRLSVVPHQQSQIDGGRPFGGVGIGDEVRRNDEKQRNQCHLFTRDQPRCGLDADWCARGDPREAIAVARSTTSVPCEPIRLVPPPGGWSETHERSAIRRS